MATNTLAENVTQAISDFADIKTAIEAKGVTVPSGTPTSDYDSLIGDIPTGDDSVLISLIERTATSLEIPQGTTAIGDYAFFYANLTSLTIPTSVASIGKSAVSYTRLSEIVVPSNVKALGERAYSYNYYAGRIVLEEGVEDIGVSSLAMIGSQSTTTPKVQPVTIPASVKNVRYSAFDGSQIETLIISKPTSGCSLFYNCFGSMGSLKTVYLPNTNLIPYSATMGIFSGDTNLEYVILENDYDIPYIDFSVSTKYSVDTLVGMLNALKNNSGISGTTAKTLKIGSTNLAKLTAEQIAIATNKNWNLA